MQSGISMLLNLIQVETSSFYSIGWKIHILRATYLN